MRRLPKPPCRGVVLLGALLLAGTALAACGSPGSASSASTSPPTTLPTSPQALAAVAQATARTTALTADFAMTFQRSSGSTASQLPLDAHGAVDFTGPSSTIRIDLPKASGGTERMVFLPGTVFFRPPPSSPPLQPGRPWIFANFADIAKYKVNFPPYIVQTESINPAFTVSEVAWGATAAAPAGTATLDGSTDRVYVVTVDLQKALAGATGANGAVFALTLASEIAASGSTSPTVTARVWVDGQGRLVGVRTVPVGAGIGTLTLALDRFGAPVQAAKPARATVVDLAAIIPGGEQEALNGGDTDGA